MARGERLISRFAQWPPTTSLAIRCRGSGASINARYGGGSPKQDSQLVILKR